MLEGKREGLLEGMRKEMQEHIVFRWMSLKSTIEYLGEWEMLYNPNFNCTEFDTIRNAAGRIPEEGYQEWDDNHKTDRLTCERMAKKLGLYPIVYMYIAVVQ